MRPAKERCETCGGWSKTTDAARRAMLEDALWLLEGGMSEHETMLKLGYTNRSSWLVALGRGGLVKVPNDGSRKSVNVLQRLRAHNHG